MTDSTGHRPYPRRQAAGRANRKKRGPVGEAGRQALRAAALPTRPWTRATGPNTPEGKARSAANGRVRQQGTLSAQQVRADLAAVRAQIKEMRAARAAALGTTPPGGAPEAGHLSPDED